METPRRPAISPAVIKGLCSIIALPRRRFRRQGLQALRELGEQDDRLAVRVSGDEVVASDFPTDRVNAVAGSLGRFFYIERQLLSRHALDRNGTFPLAGLSEDPRPTNTMLLA